MHSGLGFPSLTVALDIETLLQETSPDAPSGENLEYDPGFTEVVQLAQGKAEQQMGDAVVAGAEPDWRAVRSKSLDLLARTKDLRLSVYLTQALLRTEGFAGLGEGLALLLGLLERHWGSVHPQLDPDDDNDPTMRVNILVALRDEDAMLRPVRETPLVASRTIGRFALRDVLIATGQLSAPASDEAPPELSSIDAAAMDVDLETLQATASAVHRSYELVGAVESVLTDNVGAARAADLSDLSNLLKHAGKVVDEWLVRRGVGAANGAADTMDGPDGVAGQATSGAINSREDVVRTLDRLCAYFAQHEPSSPVPLLLNRAKRLVSKDFLEIVRDLAPDALAQVELIRGRSEDGS